MAKENNFSTFQDFFLNDNDEVKRFSPNLNWGLRICSSAFHQDIQSQIDELTKMHFSYQEETDKLKDKYIVFITKMSNISLKSNTNLLFSRYICTAVLTDGLAEFG
jgi:hypothetical protein